jgi:two-component system, response regulator RegA
MEHEEMLVVDDDAVFCRVLGRALERRGYRVRKAQTLPAARQAIHEAPPACMVLDLRLENESGLYESGLRLIDEALAVVPGMAIVVLTGFASIATAVEAIKRGARDYLAKPADADEIVAVLRGEAQKPEREPVDEPPSVRRLEWEHIQRVLRQHDGNISATARVLRMHRRTLQRKLNKKPVRR